MFRRVLSIFLTFAVFVATMPSMVWASNTESNKNQLYVQNDSDFVPSGESIVITADQNYTTDNNISFETIDDKNFLVTEETGYIEWTFDIDTTATYNIAVVWANISGKGLDIIRKISIDGSVPLNGMNSIYFRRTWKNSSEVYLDKDGNEYSQKLSEDISVRTSNLYSLTDYCAGGYCVELEAGSHAIRFDAIQEPMAIHSILLTPVVKAKNYSEVSKEYEDKGYKPVSSDVKPIVIEAEDAKYVSKNTIRPQADRTSPELVPYDVFTKKLNTIGGNVWNEPAQWIEWDFTVSESGLYKINLHAKQDFKTGFSSYRRLLIDGESPFSEANYIEFNYDLNWTNVTLGGEEEPYLVYLEKGDHKLSLEVSVTKEMSTIITRGEQLQEKLVTIYRRIIMVTGTMPDSLRDYNLFSAIENCEEDLSFCLNELKDIVKELESLGYGGSETSSMNRLIIQIEDFLRDDNTIPKRLDTFNSNIMTFSSWITTAKQQPLLLDSIWIGAPQDEAPEADSGFFKKLWHELLRLFMSFVTDYDVMDTSNGSGEQKTVTLWVGLGVDQAIVLKSLIDGDFTPNSNVNVNIELVNMGVLLRAVAADVGPDVVLFQGQNIPVEYAMRGAVYDLKNFSDLDTVLERFYPSAYESFKYEGGLYALPETQTFSMMFCRTDILDELDVEIPKTWNELYSVLAKFQTNYLSISLPTPFTGGAGTSGLNSIFMMLLYQNGGKLYSDDGKRVMIGEESGVSAFTQWVNLYTKYKVPQTTSLLTRFRMGESPIVITDYTFYNQLQVGAPEIEGKWTIAPVPGQAMSDGSINNTQASTVSSCLIFANAKDKDASWEFLKWWTSEQTQYDYGTEIEALQGASARWSTANVAAFKRLPWSTQTSKIIEGQWKNVKGVPQVAGGYYTARSIDNAIRTVVNQNENTRETLLDFVTEIDEEIAIKRKEFNLEVD